MRGLFTVLAVLALTGCDNEPGAVRETLTVGVLPDQTPTELEARYRPLIAYLSSATGLDIELSIPATYEELLDDFAAGAVDLANFGGTTYVQAEQRGPAEPLVMRDIDLEFVSCYLVQASDERPSVRDFRGEAFAFGPRLSTSGHMMPRFFLTQAGMVPEDFFGSVIHTASHDETAFRVADRTVAIGVANCEILIAMRRDGRLDDYDVRILETTPPYPNYVWTARASLAPSLKTDLRDAFLALDSRMPLHDDILRGQGARGYLPAGDADFDDLRSAFAAATTGSAAVETQ